MDEDEKNAILSTQSVDSVGSVSQDANRDLVMSKSKARSLRRKRAKQRKKAMEVKEEKTESHDKENHDSPVTGKIKNEESKKKKKKPRKKKKKSTVVEQPRTVNITETPSVIVASKITLTGETKDAKLDTNHKKTRNSPEDSEDVMDSTETPTLAAREDITTATTGVEKFQNNNPKSHNSAAFKRTPNANTEAQKSAPKNFENQIEGASVQGMPKVETSEAIENPSSDTSPKDTSKSKIGKLDPEKTNEVIDLSLADYVQTAMVKEGKPNDMPTSVYEDEDENKERTKEDCVCACVIS